MPWQNAALCSQTVEPIPLCTCISSYTYLSSVEQLYSPFHMERSVAPIVETFNKTQGKPLASSIPCVFLRLPLFPSWFKSDVEHGACLCWKGPWRLKQLQLWSGPAQLSGTRLAVAKTCLESSLGMNLMVGKGLKVCLCSRQLTVDWMWAI